MAKNEIMEKKYKEIEKFIKDNSVEGVTLENVDDNTSVMRSAYIVEGRRIPFMIVVSESVYTSFQILVVEKVSKDKEQEVINYLNRLNQQFEMLKYHMDQERNIILTCSMPSFDLHFDAILVFAIVEEIGKHLTEEYAGMMKEIWG